MTFTLLLLLVIGCVFLGKSQTIKLSKQTKTIAVNIPHNQIFILDKVKDTVLTTNKAIYKTVEYPVWAIKETGKLYICLNGKNGKYYRKYIKQD